MTSESAGFLGIDHLVVLVRDLDTAAQAWSGIGFTLSPRAVHSEVVGTANHTIMFGNDYLELLATRGHTAVNSDWHALLAAQGEGLHGLVLATSDVDAARKALSSRGVQASQPLYFERPVQRADGERLSARFRVSWTPPGTVPGLKLFVCQHLSREAVWLPELRSHPNTVQSIRGLRMQVPDLKLASEQWSRVLGPQAISTEATGATGATVHIGRHRLWLEGHQGSPRGPARAQALWLQAERLEACRLALQSAGPAAASTGSQLRVPALNGIELVFVQ